MRIVSPTSHRELKFGNKFLDFGSPIPPVPPPEPTVRIGDYDYHYVKIGTQTWLVEDLDYRWSGLYYGSSYWNNNWTACCYYNDDAATYSLTGTKKYGLLYTGHATKYLNDNRATLCPGWRVPTSSDWDTLISYVGGSSVAGQKLKAVNQSIGGQWPSNWNGTDEFGFAALPCGYFYSSFGDIESKSSYWAIVSGSANRTYTFNRTSNAVTNGNDNANGGHPVRLIKDE